MSAVATGRSFLFSFAYVERVYGTRNNHTETTQPDTNEGTDVENSSSSASTTPWTPQPLSTPNTTMSSSNHMDKSSGGAQVISAVKESTPKRVRFSFGSQGHDGHLHRPGSGTSECWDTASCSDDTDPSPTRSIAPVSEHNFPDADGSTLPSAPTKVVLEERGSTIKRTASRAVLRDLINVRVPPQDTTMSLNSNEAPKVNMLPCDMNCNCKLAPGQKGIYTFPEEIMKSAAMNSDLLGGIGMPFKIDTTVQKKRYHPDKDIANEDWDFVFDTRNDIRTKLQANRAVIVTLARNPNVTAEDNWIQDPQWAAEEIEDFRNRGLWK